MNAHDFDSRIAEKADALIAAVVSDEHDCDAWKTTWEDPDIARCSVCWTRLAASQSWRIPPAQRLHVRAYRRAWGHCCDTADEHYKHTDRVEDESLVYAEQRTSER